MLLLCAASFGAIATLAWADTSYHTTCVGHGFLHGGAMSDGSFFSRVETGCRTTTKNCALYTGGSLDGARTLSGNITCNVWSQDYGSYSECASTSHTAFADVFSAHVHKANNWCG